MPSLPRLIVHTESEETLSPFRSDSSIANSTSNFLIVPSLPSRKVRPTDTRFPRFVFSHAAQVVETHPLTDVASQEPQSTSSHSFPDKRDEPAKEDVE